MREHFTTAELAGLPGMPGTVEGVRKRAKSQGWSSRRRKGSKAREYHFCVLPEETRAVLIGAEPATLIAARKAIASRIADLEQQLAALAGGLQALKRILEIGHE